MSSLTGLLVLVGATLLLWLVLATFAAARKLRRDRRELRTLDRRTRYEAVLRDGDHDALLALHREARGVETQVDLATAIDAVREGLDAERIAQLRLVAVKSGLVDALGAELGSADPVTRGRAALLLTRTGTPSATQQVMPLLGDDDADVRLVACSGLARIATPAAAEALIWALVTRALPPERIIERLAEPWAIDVILRTIELGPLEVPTALAGIAPRGRPVDLNASLARALGVARDRRGELALLGLLRTGTEEAQVSAARSLGRTGGTLAVKPLIAALESDAWPVRAQAAKSLGLLGAAAAIEPLERCLPDRAWWVRGNSARALRQLGTPGMDALRRAAHHPDAYARDRAREQLALQMVAEELGA